MTAFARAVAIRPGCKALVAAIIASTGASDQVPAIRLENPADDTAIVLSGFYAARVEPANDVG